MTKAEEIALLGNMLAQTPADTYLRTMLQHVQVQFANDVRSDFHTLPNLTEIEREITAAQQKLSDVRKQIIEGESKLRDLQSQSTTAAAQIERIRADARDLRVRLSNI